MYYYKKAVASGSIEGVFEPQLIDGGVYVDGGTAWNINIMSAVEQCRAKGAHDSEIILDIIADARPHLPSPHLEQNAYSYWSRGHDIRHYYRSMDSINLQLRSIPNITPRWYFHRDY